MKKIFIIFTLCLILCFTLYSESFAADPKLIKTIKNAFEKISIAPGDRLFIGNKEILPKDAPGIFQS